MTVPHSNLAETLGAAGMEPELKRTVKVWLRPQGEHFCARRSIRRRLPQGGVLSPCLRLLHFNDLPELMRKGREEWGEDLRVVMSLILQYADDVTLPVAHEDPRIFTAAANMAAGGVGKDLIRLGLNLSWPKSYNLVVSAGGVVGEYSDGPSATRQRQQRAYNEMVEP